MNDITARGARDATTTAIHRFDHLLPLTGARRSSPACSLSRSYARVVAARAVTVAAAAATAATATNDAHSDARGDAHDPDVTATSATPRAHSATATSATRARARSPMCSARRRCRRGSRRSGSKGNPCSPDALARKLFAILVAPWPRTRTLRARTAPTSTRTRATTRAATRLALPRLASPRLASAQLASAVGGCRSSIVDRRSSLCRTSLYPRPLRRRRLSAPPPRRSTTASPPPLLVLFSLSSSLTTRARARLQHSPRPPVRVDDGALRTRGSRRPFLATPLPHTKWRVLALTPPPLPQPTTARVARSTKRHRRC